MQDPREPHLKVVFHLLRYIKTDIFMGLFLSKDSSFTVRAYYNSDCATYPDTRKSVSGYVVFLGERPVSWKSKKQATISLSSIEAEYRALRQAVGELIWLYKLLMELTVPVTLPIQIYCDSHSALHIAKNLVFHKKTKHIEVDCHFVRNQLQDGLISLHHVPTKDQLIDVLTKALTGVKHSAILSKLFVF